MVQCQGDPDQDKTYSEESQYYSKPGKSDRMVSAPSSLSRNLPGLAQVNGVICLPPALMPKNANLRISRKWSPTGADS